MSIRQRAGDLGSADARRLGRALGSELRGTRVAIGLSQATVARAAGMSPSQLGRLERGETIAPTLEQVCRGARALGLSTSIRLHPVGVPVRDAAHLALLGRLQGLLAPSLTMRREVPVPGDGMRAWDALVEGSGCCFCEAETRLGDLQALARRMELKLRDDPRSSVLVLAVGRTRHNHRVLAAHRETLRLQFPLDGAAIARALRSGRIPSASGIIVL